MPRRTRTNPSAPLPDFQIDDWVERGGFDADQHHETIHLVARLDKGVGEDLFETPLERQRSLKPGEDGWLELVADVREKHQLWWWIRGFGAQVELIEPSSLRQAVADDVAAQINRYRIKQALSAIS